MEKRGTKRLTEEICRSLYRQYGTPEHVIRHCRAVSMVAVTLGEQLNAHGYTLNIPLIRGASLIHDMVRLSEDHGVAGAKILEGLGYYEEAAIVRVHMTYNFHDFSQLDETDLVCLADRLVKEDHYVGLDERIDYILHKAPKEAEIQNLILQKKEETRRFMEAIETTIGQTIDSLFQRADNTEEERLKR